ncbi:MAG TPA: tetratricopeptide repeat protein [Dongiaceae bacterium]|jgi:TolA-binding protein|nr:tetratricopeptide repeat protein [Dongiaceae bacterium]
MAFLRQSFFILFALILSGGQIFAASATKEQRAYAAAVSTFQDEMWGRAETEFAQFTQKYPKSTNAPVAVLMQAQAEFKQGKLTNAAALLASRKSSAGNLADQYIYWIGESQFQIGDFPSAAKTFTSLAQNYSESPLRLRAVVEASSAYVQLDDWMQTIRSLEETNGVFQRAVQMDSANELVSRGQLLLAQAKFTLKDFSGAAAVLESLNSQTLAPQLDWQRAYLLCQVKLAVDDLPAALAVTTNLAQIARLENDYDLSAESVALRADILKKLNRADDAIAAYQENLVTNAPPERQRQAILKIAELAIAQNQFTNAEQKLANFLQQFSDAPSADIALLTLGELHLKDCAAQPSVATNHLQSATAAFDKFLVAFPKSSLAGKAFLDRGWCEWIAGKIPECLADFKMAAQKLPPSEDLAVAKLKIGDALFAQKDYAGALENFRSVLGDFSDFPQVEKDLGERALYQDLRADLELDNTEDASNALAQILEKYPAGETAQGGTLLLGEASTDSSQARDLFESFDRQFSGSLLRPQAELAVARTYEREQNWSAAVTNYESWLKNYPTNEFRPRADYSLAWADFQAGDETNAFMQFTNFVARFPANELAPQAQWCAADSFYRSSDFVNAEKNYKYIFQNTNWQSSTLIYPARMMAGRAAVGRLGYSDAVAYFTSLVDDTNCPADLNAQARFAWGGALMQMPSADTNSPLANFLAATNVFGQIIQMFPTNELGALAWGELANCYLQLTNYDAATNAFAQVFNSPYANVSARSGAKIGFGLALEKIAALSSGTNQTALLQFALGDYLDVFETVFGKNLRDGETADAFWVKKAGLQALSLIKSLNAAPPEKFIDEMETLLPQLKESLEKIRGALPPKS